MIKQSESPDIQFVAGTKYRVDPVKGVLYSVSGKPLTRCNTGGYVVAKGGAGTKFAHRVIWQHVNGPVPDGMEINHINGIKNDNRIANLELATPSENIRHAYATGLNKAANGEASARAKLTAANVESIHVRRANGESAKKLALEMGVSVDTISAVTSGRRWGGPKHDVAKVPHESRQIDMSATAWIASLSKTDASGRLFDVICETYGIKSDSALAIKLGANHTTISYIRCGNYGPSAELILKVYDTCGLSIERIRELINTPSDQPHN